MPRRHARARRDRGRPDAGHRQLGGRRGRPAEGDCGPKSIKFVCLLTCPEGMTTLQEAHPDVPIYTAAIDRELERARLHPARARRRRRPDLRHQVRLAPRLAHFVSLATPYRGQHQRPGEAGSAVFACDAVPVRIAGIAASLLGCRRLTARSSVDHCVRSSLSLAARFAGWRCAGGLLALAQAKLKVAAVYTVPFEQQWVGRIHKALKAAEARGEIEYKATRERRQRRLRARDARVRRPAATS